MIKLLHFADVHLGIENYGTVDKRTGLHSRFSDFLKCFDYLVDYALDNRVDFVLFAGDAFKTRDPSPTYVREFAKRIKKIARAKIPVILLVGNHDLPNAIGKADTMEIYKTLEVDNVYVSKKPEILRFKRKNGVWQKENGLIQNPEKKTEIFHYSVSLSDTSQQFDKVLQIVTLPWLSKNSFVKREDYQSKTIEQIHQMMTDKLIETVDELAQQINPNLPAVLLGHLTLASAKFGSEQKVHIGSDAILPLDVLINKPWNYVALGHLHRFQVLAKNPPVIYSGSIERVDFGEEKEDKGFVMLSLNTNIFSSIKNQNASLKKNTVSIKTNYKFIPTPARKFVTIKVQLSEEDKFCNQKILNEIKRHDIKDAIVRLIVEIPQNLIEDLCKTEIRKALADAYFVAGINFEIIQSVREKSIANIESLSIIEALEKYLQSKKVDKKRIEELKAYTRKLIEQE